MSTDELLQPGGDTVVHLLSCGYALCGKPGPPGPSAKCVEPPRETEPAVDADLRIFQLMELKRADLTPNDVIDLLQALLAWRQQGAARPSTRLVQAVDRLRERYPDLCEALTLVPEPG